MDVDKRQSCSWSGIQKSGCGRWFSHGSLAVFVMMMAIVYLVTVEVVELEGLQYLFEDTFLFRFTVFVAAHLVDGNLSG